MLDKGCSYYCEGDSIVHKLHPSIKIFGLFCFILFCLLKYNNYLFIVNLTLVFLLLLFSNVDFYLYFKDIWKFKYIIALFYLISYRLGMNISDVNIIVFKIVFFIMYIDIIRFTTTRLDISKGISNLFNIFNFLNVNLRKLTISLLDFFSFKKDIKNSTNKYLNSFDVKGGIYTQNNIIGRIRIFVGNIKNIFIVKKENKKIRKYTINRHLYNKKRSVSYKYLYKYKILDYLFVIMYLGMIVFYVLKVR